MMSSVYQTFISLVRYGSCKENDAIETKGKIEYKNEEEKNILNVLEPVCIIDYKETAPFVPPITCGQVIKVYDGDTITIASKLPYPESPLYRFQVRLNGIDCPELKSKSEDEKTIALLAKKEMEDLTFQKIVYLKNSQNEKFGRILADVYIDNIHLNTHMLSKRLAVAYDGGTKRVPESWIKYHCADDM